MLFLLNCHATPWQAHLHRQDLRLTFLDCAPQGYAQDVLAMNEPGSACRFACGGPADSLEQEWHETEQRRFWIDPLHHLCTAYGVCGGDNGSTGMGSAPLLLVVYNQDVERVSSFLSQQEYSKVARFSHEVFNAVDVEILRR